MKKILLLAILLLPATAWAQSINNLDTLRSKTGNYLREPTPNAFSDADRRVAVNEAERLLVALTGFVREKDTTISTANGVRRYKMPSDFHKIAAVSKGTGSAFKYLTYVAPEALFSISQASLIEYYSIWADSLEVSGTPTGITSLKVMYYAKPQLLDSATQVTDLHYHLQPAIPLVAAAYLLDRKGEYSTSNMFWQRAATIIARFNELYGRRFTEPSLAPPR